MKFAFKILIYRKKIVIGREGSYKYNDHIRTEERPTISKMTGGEEFEEKVGDLLQQRRTSVFLAIYRYILVFILPIVPTTSSRRLRRSKQLCHFPYFSNYYSTRNYLLCYKNSDFKFWSSFHPLQYCPFLSSALLFLSKIARRKRSGDENYGTNLKCLCHTNCVPSESQDSWNSSKVQEGRIKALSQTLTGVPELDCYQIKASPPISMVFGRSSRHVFLTPTLASEAMIFLLLWKSRIDADLIKQREWWSIGV